MVHQVLQVHEVLKDQKVKEVQLVLEVVQEVPDHQAHKVQLVQREDAVQLVNP